MLAQIPPRRFSPGDGTGSRDPHSAPARGRRPRRARAVALTAIVASLGVAGCGNSTAPVAPTLSGTYAFDVSVTERRDELRCYVSGTVEFMQEGELFSGRGESRTACSGLGIDFSREEMPLIEGQFRGRAADVEFTILNSPCEACGNASGSPVETLSGTVRCTFLINDRIFTLDGRWELAAARPELTQAHRRHPVAPRAPS